MIVPTMQVVEERTHESRDLSKTTQQLFFKADMGNSDSGKSGIASWRHFKEDRTKKSVGSKPYLVPKVTSTKSLIGKNSDIHQHETAASSKRTTMVRRIDHKQRASLAGLKIANDAVFKIQDYGETKRLLTQLDLESDPNARHIQTSRIDYLMPTFPTPGPGKYNTSKNILKRSINTKAGLRSLPNLGNRARVLIQGKLDNLKKSVNSKSEKDVSGTNDQSEANSKNSQHNILKNLHVKNKGAQEKDFWHPIELPSEQIYQPPIEASELFGSQTDIRRRAVIPQNFAMKELLKEIPRPGGKTELQSVQPRRKVRQLKVTQGSSLDRQFAGSLAATTNHHTIHKHFFAQLPSAYDPPPGPPRVRIKHIKLMG